MVALQTMVLSSERGLPPGLGVCVQEAGGPRPEVVDEAIGWKEKLGWAQRPGEPGRWSERQGCVCVVVSEAGMGLRGEGQGLGQAVGPGVQAALMTARDLLVLGETHLSRIRGSHGVSLLFSDCLC